jgi:hypothetical protein
MRKWVTEASHFPPNLELTVNSVAVAAITSRIVERAAQPYEGVDGRGYDRAYNKNL